MGIPQLNQQFGIDGQIQFADGKGGLPIVTISNQYATAEIFLHGAHVASYAPKGEEDVLWMSQKSSFEDGKPIRGGIPVCFPWFGPHATDTKKPQHGFARLLPWQVVATATLPNGASQVVLQLDSSDHTKTLWPYPFSAKLTVTVGPKLDVALTVTNTGTETFVFSDALHSYFNISDVAKIGIDGLSGITYQDAKDGTTKKQDAALLTITEETNRRCWNHSADCIISDPGFGRKVRVAKTGSNVTVVWNPGAEVNKTIGDMQENGYKTFVCIEAANIFDDAVTLAPGGVFTVSTIINME